MQAKICISRRAFASQSCAERCLKGGECCIRFCARRTAPRGPLRHKTEGHTFAERHLCRLLSQPAHTCRADALHIAAVGREIQIGFEDLILAVVALKLESPEHLLRFAGDSSRIDAKS